MTNSDEAEAQALANVLLHLEKLGRLKRGALVMLQCDNVNALAGVRRMTGAKDRPIRGGCSVHIHKAKLQPRFQSALDVIRSCVTRNELQVVVRHVKGHQQGDGRNWVNRECDRLAKQGMRARRAQILAQDMQSA